MQVVCLGVGCKLCFEELGASCASQNSLSVKKSIHQGLTVKGCN